MDVNAKLLENFAANLRKGVHDELKAQSADAGIFDIVWYGDSVELELANGEHWAIECVGLNAFRVYPGIVRGDTVTWLNLWVVEDYALEKMIEEVNRLTVKPS